MIEIDSVKRPKICVRVRFLLLPIQFSTIFKQIADCIVMIWSQFRICFTHSQKDLVASKFKPSKLMIYIENAIRSQTVTNCREPRRYCYNLSLVVTSSDEILTIQTLNVCAYTLHVRLPACLPVQFLKSSICFTFALPFVSHKSFWLSATILFSHSKRFAYCNTFIFFLSHKPQCVFLMRCRV